MAAEALAEANLPGADWLLTKKGLLIELGMVRPDFLVPIAERMIEMRPLVAAGRKLIRRGVGLYGPAAPAPDRPATHRPSGPGGAVSR